MEPQESTYIDKSTWGEGPWKTEPDRIEWRAEGTPRLACLIVRGGGGALCGYVGVPEGHPWHGKDYGDVDAHAHGGLTYADRCQVDGKICHVPQPGESDAVWWIGFDCAHHDDLRPQHGSLVASMDFIDVMLGQGGSGGLTYKDVAFVRAEVERLAVQAQRVAKGLSAEDE